MATLAKKQSGGADSAWLIPLPGGPPLEPLELKPASSGAVIGRHEQCNVRLPLDADKVSRQHARFLYHGDGWHIADLKSRWGTFVNGVKIPPQREMPLVHGDLVRIVPWTFSFSTQGVPRRGLVADDDTATAMTMIRSHTQSDSPHMKDDLVTLLLESASALHASEDEKGLAAALMDIACRGTGLPNATVLRALDSSGRVEVLAARAGPGKSETAHANFSRSLLAAASRGVVAELSAGMGGGTADISTSMVQMKIDAAICVPLMMGSTLAAYLYLDSRGGSAATPRTLRPNASGFCVALAKMAGLALANLKRIDVERRAVLIDAELNAAAAAQRWILPHGETIAGPFVCSGQDRPGEYLGGDFFDTMVMPDGRLFVSLGDVSGHGIAASVLMTASQGFLHAALAGHGDLARAVSDLNVFLHPRRPENKFVTLWAGVFDPKKMTVSYVDAGHGYGLLIRPDHTFEPLAGGAGLPVGILDDSQYELTVASLPAGARVLIVSDGIIEQTESESQPGQPRQQFEVQGVQAAIASAKPNEDAVERLFQAVYKFAGGTSLSDDATAVLVKW